MKTKIGEGKLKELAMPEFKYTNEQMFFIANAQGYCSSKEQDHVYFLATLIRNDPHGADRVRVNAISMQMDEFRTAFSCRTWLPSVPWSRTDPMVTLEKQKCYLLPSGPVLNNVRTK
jgi:hypothetical protein